MALFVTGMFELMPGPILEFSHPLGRKKLVGKTRSDGLRSGGSARLMCIVQSDSGEYNVRSSDLFDLLEASG